MSLDGIKKYFSIPYVNGTFFVLIGFLLGLFVWWLWPSPDSGVKQVRQISSNDYRFISPLLECEVGNAIREEKSMIDKGAIENLIDNKISEGKARVVSVYYRDLNNGPWFGINETEEFAPASLLKVPLMMAYFKKAESEPDILKKEIEYKKSTPPNINQNFVPSHKLEKGKKYRAEELIESMIKYSDNDSAMLLLENLDNESLDRTYTDLGLQSTSIGTGENIINVVDYASFFRMLFNASYLSRTYSERALQLLSQAEFQDGLVAGTPDDVEVAHKFGEREVVANNRTLTKQLHDCGVVYYPEHPFLLCVMSKGDDFKELSGVIKEVTQLTYNEVNAQIKNK